MLCLHVVCLLFFKKTCAYQLNVALTSHLYLGTAKEIESYTTSASIKKR